MKFYSTFSGVVTEVYSGEYGRSALVRCPLVDEAGLNAGFANILVKSPFDVVSGDHVTVGVYDYYNRDKGADYRGLKRVIGVGDEI